MSYDYNFPVDNLYSQWGNIYARGSSETRNVFKQAVANSNIDLDNVIIHGKVQSQWGHVSANYSKLANVIAYYNINLINSSAIDLRSQWGSVSVSSKDLTEISSITAYNSVNIDRASVHGRITSQWGHVSANQSKLGSITAYNDIDLTNSSASDLQSRWGSITVKQTSENQSEISSITAYNNVSIDRTSVDGRIRSQWGQIFANHSKLGSVTAYKNIDLTNSSALDLRSEWGNVTIRQTDGTQRIISHITARNKIIAENSIVDNVTLYVGQNQKALLDLTNTKVSEKIVVKMSDSFSKISHIVFSFFGFLWSWGHNSSNEPKQFNLLIKGTAMPENIVFEGFDEDEITLEMTNNGILVTGKKK